MLLQKTGKKIPEDMTFAPASDTVLGSKKQGKEKASSLGKKKKKKGKDYYLKKKELTIVSYIESR